MNKLLNHFLAMQGRAAAFVEPTPSYVDRDGNSSDAAGEGLEAPQRNHLFASDMLYMLDGPEEREAVVEASFNYVAEAQLTLSASWHGDKVAKAQFVSRINATIEACRKLDQVKKTLFYGRDNNLISEGQADLVDLRDRVGGGGINGERVIHAVIGIATEAGELLEGLRENYNGGNYDAVNIREELGDVFWYIAILAAECGFTFDDVMRVNIAKLRQRYPNAFTEYDAENRNLIEERLLLERSLVDETSAEAQLRTLGPGIDEAVEARQEFEAERDSETATDYRSELHKPIGERATLMPGEAATRQRVRASDLPGPDNVGMVDATRQYDGNSSGLDPEAD